VSVVQSSAFCHTCGKQSLFQKPRVNHVLHLILTVLTLGLWGFVWLTLGILNSSKGSRCVTCGMKQGATAQRVAPGPAQPVVHVEAHELSARAPERP
jgi:hypothetical protein